MKERWQLFWKRVGRIAWVAAALLFLCISWIWDRLYLVAEAVIAWIPFEDMKQAVRRFMDKLQPYPTLIAFLIPLITHELMKFGALVLFEKHLWWWGAAIYLLADVIGITLCAYLFEVNREKLLSIGWFNRCYLWLVAFKDWALVQVAPMRARLHAALAEAAHGKHSLFSRLRGLWRFIRRRSR